MKEYPPTTTIRTTTITMMVVWDMMPSFYPRPWPGLTSTLSIAVAGSRHI